MVVGGGAVEEEGDEGTDEALLCREGEDGRTTRRLMKSLATSCTRAGHAWNVRCASGSTETVKPPVKPPIIDETAAIGAAAAWLPSSSALLLAAIGTAAALLAIFPRLATPALQKLSLDFACI